MVHRRTRRNLRHVVRKSAGKWGCLRHCRGMAVFLVDGGWCCVSQLKAWSPCKVEMLSISTAGGYITNCYFPYFGFEGRGKVLWRIIMKQGSAGRDMPGHAMKHRHVTDCRSGSRASIHNGGGSYVWWSHNVQLIEGLLHNQRMPGMCGTSRQDRYWMVLNNLRH